MKKNRTALITGATGFVGSHLSQRLVLDGWQVHVIIRESSDMTPLKNISENMQVHLYDNSTNSLLNIIADVKPDVVFHVASLFLAQHDTQDIEPLIQSNILFGTRLADAMTKTGVYHLVNTGTSWQHYENEDYNPVNLYAATKQAFEAILKYYADALGLKVITLKLFDTYGPNDRRPKLFNLLRKIADDNIPLKMSPGEQLLDLVYIDDVIEAFIMAAKRITSLEKGKIESYAVSSGHPIHLRDVVTLYEQVMGKSLPIQWGGREYRIREVMKPWDRGTPLPGWKPKFSLEKGIKILMKQP